MVTTSMGSINSVLIPRQVTQPIQPKANEKTAAEELKAEEQHQVENVSASKISTVKSAMDLRMYSIHQAADAGLLRPIWLETMDMDPDMPRMRDLITRVVEKPEEKSERVADEAERVDKFKHVAVETGHAEKSENAAVKTGHAVKSESVAVETERAVKSEGATDGAKRAVKSEGAKDGARQVVTSSKGNL